MAAGDGIIGALLVTLGIDTGVFEDGLKKANGDLNKFGNSAKAFGAMAVNVLAAGAAAAGAAVVKFGFDAMDAADNIGDTAQLLGMATDNVQAFKIAFQKAGKDPEIFDASMSKLNKNLGEFIVSGGKGGAAKALEELGLSNDILSGKIKGTDNAFIAITKAMDGIKDPSEKAALSAKLFGKAAGDEMIEVLGNGSEAIKSWIDAAKASGQVFTEDEVEKLAGYRQQLKNLQADATNMAMVFSGKAMIAIGDFATSMKPAFEEAKKVGEQIANYLKPSVDGLVQAFSSLATNDTLIAALKGVATVVGKVFIGSFKLALDTITAVVKTIDWFINKLGETIKWVKDTTKAFGDFGKNIVDGLVNGIKSGADWAKNTITKLADDMKAAFKKAWKIASPSKEAAQDGKHIVEGIAVGVNDNAFLAISAVDKLSFDLLKKLHGVKWKEALSSDLKALIEDLKTEEEKWNEYFNASVNTLKNALQAKEITQEKYNLNMERLLSENLSKQREFADRQEQQRQQELENQRAYVTEMLGGIKSLEDEWKNNPELAPKAIEDTGLSQQLDKAADKWAEVFDHNEKMSEAFANTFKDGLMAALDGDFKDFAINWLKGFADKALTDFLKGIGDAMFMPRDPNDKQGGWMQAIGDVFSNIFGGARALGGPVKRGVPYLVNEDTPRSELFVPDMDGTIVPFENLRQSRRDGGIVNHFHFNMPNVTDYQSFKKSEGQMAALLANAVSRGMRNQ